MELSYPYFFVFGFLFIAGLFFSLPIFNYMDTKLPHPKSHNIPLESIRYFLASFVFIAHSIGINDFILTGDFRGKYDQIDLLARSGVALFFAITGLLFWGKIKKGNTNWISLYVNRFFRIVPLIWFNSALICIIIIGLTREAPSIEIIKWFDFINNNRPDFTSMKGTWIFTAGVFWTLVFEWGFYFLLPALSMFARRSFEFSTLLAFILVYTGKIFFPQLQLHYLMFFVIGMLASDISDRINLKKHQLDIILSSSIALLLIFRPFPNDVSSFANVLYLIIMICINKKADIFGLLKIKGFQRLGAASYSIYIMHAVVLYSLLEFAQKNNFLFGNEKIIYISGYFAVLLVSTLTYKFIEEKFMSIDRSLKTPK
jgi:peptidoglycan/LPS O-acetylase OafA/YrhL